MRIIEIKAMANGGHRNQTGDFATVPSGYAVIPEHMETVNFPFGEIEVEEIGGVLTVTKWTPGEIPEPEPAPEAEPTTEELVNILLGVADNE